MNKEPISYHTTTVTDDPESEGRATIDWERTVNQSEHGRNSPPRPHPGRSGREAINREQGLVHRASCIMPRALLRAEDTALALARLGCATLLLFVLHRLQMSCSHILAATLNNDSYCGKCGTGPGPAVPLAHTGAVDSRFVALSRPIPERGSLDSDSSHDEAATSHVIRPGHFNGFDCRRYSSCR